MSTLISQRADEPYIVLWGAISTAAGAVHNYAGILAVRLTLGVAEAVFFPVALFTLSKFYTKEEMVSYTRRLSDNKELPPGSDAITFAGVSSYSILCSCALSWSLRSVSRDS